MMARIFLNHVKFGAVQLLTAKYHYFSTLIEINVPGLVLKKINSAMHFFMLAQRAIQCNIQIPDRSHELLILYYFIQLNFKIKGKNQMVNQVELNMFTPCCLPEP